jgi:hypothetical protein
VEREAELIEREMEAELLAREDEADAEPLECEDAEVLAEEWALLEWADDDERGTEDVDAELLARETDAELLERATEDEAELLA